MRHRLCLLLTALLLPAGTALAAGPQVEIRANEVWVIKEGQARQLTSDGKSKLEAVLSPSGDRSPITSNACKARTACPP